MRKQEVVVNLNNHADVSPAALLVQLSCQYRSEIHLEVGKNKTINAKSIMGVMTLDYKDGERVAVVAEGSDEDDAFASVCAFLSGEPLGLAN